ncbi:POK9 protein, partial [Emberiza fucata]|nr:POK9 protein [Emberiza fucata]
QLWAPVSQFGVTGEPTKQMLDYIWGTQVLLPANCRGIAKLILTQHQQILFGTHWKALCLDLAASVAVTLMTSQPEKVPTGIKGPIIINGQPMGALLLGRSAATMTGLFVLTGVIDAGFTGEICVMVYTPFPLIRIEKGQKIAQLVPLEQLTKTIPPHQSQSRGEQGFGSTSGLTLLTMNLNERPKHTVIIEYQGERQTLQGLLDTGADSSIISPEFWPHNWPLQPTTMAVAGAGGLTLARKS